MDSQGDKAEPDHLGLLLYRGGTVCDDSFDEIVADTICKYMGYTSATGWTSQVEGFEIRYRLEIKLDNVQCSSADWNSCIFSEEHNCGHDEDVFLSCSYQLKYGESPEEMAGVPVNIVRPFCLTKFLSNLIINLLVFTYLHGLIAK